MALTKVQAGMTDAPTLGTAVTASGTSVDFTGIPSTAKRITVMFSGVSTNGTSYPLIQIGAGSIATTGYLSVSTYNNGTAGAATNSTAGYIINNTAQAVMLITGTYVFSLLNAATGLWIGSATLAFDGVVYNITAGGSKTLSGALDRIRITTVNGTDTFDAGSINIMWE